jgi:type IV secretion system protein VirB9
MRNLAAGILASLFVGLAQAETVPAQGTVDARARTVLYNRDEVYRLHGWVGQEIHIEFETGESFVALSGGDLDALTLGSERNSLSIKPRAAFVDSNFTIITTERYYHVRYTAAIRRRREDAQEAIYSLRFIYPQDEVQARARAAQRLDALLTTEAVRGPRNSDYWFCGSPSLRPVEASDNGVHTRLRFDERTEWPAIFVREEDGSESLVNFSVRGRDLLIHRVARQFVLRGGNLVGCVVNRGFAGSAVSADSGTVSPEVQRQIRGTDHE